MIRRYNKSKKAFVIMETIIVITVLSVILTVLYAAYSKILISVNKKALYDNMEYIYKTATIREYLENNLLENQTIEEYIGSNDIITYCSNSNLNTDVNSCQSYAVMGNDLFDFMKVYAIYFMKWNTNNIDQTDLYSLEATTQSYIKSLDPENFSDIYRIIIMYTDENSPEEPNYQYATLRIGSRD